MSRSFGSIFRVIALAGIALVLATSPTLSQVQTRDQRRCIAEQDRAFAKVGDAQGKVIKLCVRAEMAEKLDQPLLDCFFADAKGRVAKESQDAYDAQVDHCSVPPDFGYQPDPQAIIDASIIDELQLFFGMFGTDVNTAIIPKSADRARARCLLKVTRGIERIIRKKRDEFIRCKVRDLRSGAIQSQSELEGCYDEVAMDVRQKIVKPISWLDRAVQKFCSSVDLDVVFPGRCVGAPDFTQCADDFTDCRFCVSQNIADNLNEDCDLYDNGLDDGSCLAVECGNGTQEVDEDCDDGNNIDGDCCAADCTFESSGAPCTDGNVCTDDSCDGAGTCVSVNNTAECDDGIFCNGDGSDLDSGDVYGGDSCSGGSCSVHTGDPCVSAGVECQIQCNEGPDTCADPAGLACTDEGNQCTDDVCDGGGACVHPNDDSNACTDGQFCTDGDHCVSGSCIPGAGDPCVGADGDGDCQESCDEGADNCLANDPDGSACDNGSFCDGTETCSSGVCTNSTGDPCAGPDGDADCQESCDEIADNCLAPDSDGAPCDDGVFCNGTDQCSGGTCSVHSGDPCAGADGDGNCQESCDEGADNCLANDPNGSACDNGSFCDGTETCTAGVCTNSTGDPCAGPDGDGNCLESCDEGADNCFAADPDGSSCDDGVFCNGADQCSSGACVIHPGDPCPGPDGDGDCSESCDEGADNCTFPDPAASVCDDSVFCNGTDTCTGGTCSVHTGDPCVGPDGDANCSESCDEGADNCLGADPDNTSCTDDGDPCTDDICSSGGCSHPQTGDCKYVSPTGSGTACSPASPCSLATGLTQVASSTVKEVRMDQGTYTVSNEITNIGSGVTLRGGYDSSSSWAHTAGCTASVISRNPSNPDGSASVDQRIVAVQLSGVSGFTVECLSITTADATGSTGMSTYGVHLTGASGYAFTDVTITAGNAAPGSNGSNGSNGTGGGSAANGTAGLADGSSARSGGNGGTGGGSGGGVLGGGASTGTGTNGGDSTNARAGGGGGGGGGGGFHGTGGNGGQGGGVNGGANQTNVGTGGSGGNCSTAGGTGTGGGTGAVGSTGGTGSAGTSGTRSTFWLNGGQGGTGGSGGGGKGGTGGGGGGGQDEPGQPGPSPTCVDGVGAGGGGGGGGGQGGTGGTGGRGGGSSYAVYLVNNGGGTFTGGARTAGSAGTGGIGGSGGTGGGAGSRGTGGAAATGVGGGGDGGFGGTGGNAGTGGAGQSGESVAVVTQSGSAPTINP